MYLFRSGLAFKDKAKHLLVRIITILVKTDTYSSLSIVVLVTFNAVPAIHAADWYIVIS